jgi:hypothetical protein
VNLSFAVNRICKVAKENVELPREALLEKLCLEAKKIHEEDIEMCRSISTFGLELVKDGDKAYCIYERPHSELIITPLTEDYMGVEEDNYNSYFHYGYPPFIREAPATFVHNGKIYMITSGTTSKFPNPSETAVADTYMGEWKVLGDPHVNDAKKTSFDSQISCIFKHPKKKNLFIAMADRWLVDLPDDMPDICAVFESMFNPDKETIKVDMQKLTRKDTSIADYVWLPIEFDGDTPIIKWYDEWRWEDFV